MPQNILRFVINLKPGIVLFFSSLTWNYSVKEINSLIIHSIMVTHAHVFQYDIKQYVPPIRSSEIKFEHYMRYLKKESIQKKSLKVIDNLIHWTRSSSRLIDIFSLNQFINLPYISFHCTTQFYADRII